MLLNYGVGEDSWESLGLQGDPTSPFWRRSALGLLWREWCWKLKLQYFGHLVQRVDSLEKTLMLGGIGGGRDWGQEEKGTTEDEMARWHHRLNGRGFGWTPGVGDGQGGLGAAIHGVAKSWTRLSDWTELNWIISSVEHLFICQLAIWCKELTHWKRPWCWERLKAGGEEDKRGWDVWMASLTQWIWVWASSGSWYGQRGLVCCSSCSCKESDTTEQLNWTDTDLCLQSGVSAF